MAAAGRAARGPAQCPAGHCGEKGDGRHVRTPGSLRSAPFRFPGRDGAQPACHVTRPGLRGRPPADDTLIVTANATSAPPLPGRRGNELQLLHDLLLRHAPEAFDRVIEATLVEDLDTAVGAMAEGLDAVGEQILDDADRAALSVVRAALRRRRAAGQRGVVAPPPGAVA